MRLPEIIRFRHAHDGRWLDSTCPLFRLKIRAPQHDTRTGRVDAAVDAAEKSIDLRSAGCTAQGRGAVGGGRHACNNVGVMLFDLGFELIRLNCWAVSLIFLSTPLEA